MRQKLQLQISSSVRGGKYVIVSARSQRCSPRNTHGPRNCEDFLPMYKLQIPLFTFQKSPYCETQKRCVLAQPGAETMSSSTTTPQNEGKSTNRKRLQALLLAWYILCWGEAAPHSGTCSFPGTHEHIHDSLERALTMSLAPMWCTQQVTVTISITANVLAFIYI